MTEQDIISPAYTAFVMHRFKKLGDPVLEHLHAAVGMSTEAGELLDNAKKRWIYEKPVDSANVLEELGDLLFYFTAMCQLHHFTLGQIETENMRKLNIRYPTGDYTDADAQARVDKLLEEHKPQIYEGGKLA